MDIEYQLIRSGRKTIEIRVKPDGKVEVRCNNKTSIADIENFMLLKKDWIIKHQNINVNLERTPFEVGMELPFLGKDYPTEATGDTMISFDNHTFRLLKDNPLKSIKLLYKSMAKKIIQSRMLIICKKVSLYPENISITDAKTRWGSCSGKDRISFSWRLIMADEAAIDYVILHELIHIEEKNHSKRFWDKVEKFMPDYKEKEKTLKLLAERLRKSELM